MNTGNVLENEEVNIDVEDFQIPPNVENLEIPMENKVPKVVLAKEKEVQNEEVEFHKGNTKTVSEEPKVEEEKVQVKEIRVEERDTTEALKKYLMEQEEFDLELA